MANWHLFAGVVVSLTAVFLWLARTTQRVVNDGEGHPEGSDPLAGIGDVALLANVTVSQAVFGGMLLATAWYTRVPASALGLTGFDGLGLGVAIGIGLSLANRAAERGLEWLGRPPNDDLLELLSPESRIGWVILLVVVLPAVAGVEELLFRGAWIGALAVGFDLPVWGLVVLSSLLFGVGHGMQGRAGVVVAAGLGVTLGVTFVVTGSLGTVIVAHYVVNALEFVWNRVA